jgi:hypothetical protein
VKRLVSLQFLNLRRLGRTPWTGGQPFAKLLPTQDSTKHRIGENISCLRPRGHCDTHQSVSLRILKLCVVIKAAKNTGREVSVCFSEDGDSCLGA